MWQVLGVVVAVVGSRASVPPPARAEITSLPGWTDPLPSKMTNGWIDAGLPPSGVGTMYSLLHDRPLSLTHLAGPRMPVEGAVYPPHLPPWLFPNPLSILAPCSLSRSFIPHFRVIGTVSRLHPCDHVTSALGRFQHDSSARSQYVRIRS
jgi:hypothetical protein